jgi:hypothetical protein
MSLFTQRFTTHKAVTWHSRKRFNENFKLRSPDGVVVPPTLQELPHLFRNQASVVFSPWPLSVIKRDNNTGTCGVIFEVTEWILARKRLEAVLNTIKHSDRHTHMESHHS